MFVRCRSFTKPCCNTIVRLSTMAGHLGNGNSSNETQTYSIKDIPKSNVFTTNLPPDPEFPKPADSHRASRDTLGPRMVKGAIYTYVRPVISKDPELLAVSPAAMKDLGLKDGDQNSEDFKAVVAGNKIITWDEAKEDGIYPWAHCYGGWQFGSWAGQLGDGRAISLFETTNTKTNRRYELQLKGAGITPYSRFADGRAVTRSSIREFIVSEALNALNIPTTRALSLTFLPKVSVQRERIEPGAIVARFAESWLRIGTFDILRARGDRKLIRKLATYVAENVFDSWESLPGRVPLDDIQDFSPEAVEVNRGVPAAELQGTGSEEENRFVRLYREIVRRNAKTVAAWQAYAFTNGVLNTDNTSILGLSIDFGPFAFLDNFDPSYTPNHDDHALRYSYRNQPTIIWWNLVRLGEDLGELLGAGAKCDDNEFVEKGVTEDFAPELVKRAETIITRAGGEYKAVFMAEYRKLTTARLGLKKFKETDFDTLQSVWLDILESVELDFNQSFRKLSNIRLDEVETTEQRKEVAKRFFHKEGVTGVGETQESAQEKIAEWLQSWRERILEDWGNDESSNAERIREMKKVNPKFIPKSWILDELIQRVEKGGEREILERIQHMALNPFEDDWGWNRDEEERFCGDVPRFNRAMQCSCSS